MPTATASPDSAEARRRLADTLTAEGMLTEGSPWYEAFATVPREIFVPRFTLSGPDGRRAVEPGDADYLDAVYTDTTLTIRHDDAGTPISSSSQPSVMARMLEAFAVPADARILEIGTGTGYNTALLCHLLGAVQVTTIDVDPELTATARLRLADIGHHPTVVTGDGTQGHLAGAPYDGILATCGVDRLPIAWTRQVRPGGTIVTNIGNGVVRLTVDQDGTAEGRFLPDDAMFMRARPAPDHTAPAAGQFTGLIMKETGTRREMGIPVPADEVIHTLAHEVWMLQHDVLSMSFETDPATLVHGLVHPSSGSWARITPQAGDRVTVEHGGARDLWTERLDLAVQWAAAHRPRPGVYTLTIGSCGTHTLRRTGTSPVYWTF
ncbi:methyltransferase domain-containing protein [Streptomyces sp. NPDC048057]|uniref:methyltransferase domain-containing protein n=1 Tax=Streptomyces sp. NPDC048057 TaxID=3155628 RepID=UPI0033E70465